MRAQTFKEMLATTGPDRPKTPMLSREERLTQSMPPVVVEMLEQRRLMSFTHEMDGSTLVITGSSSGEFIGVSVNAGTGSITIYDIGGDQGNYYPGTVALIKILAGGGNDTTFINRSGSTSVPESCLIYGEGGDDSINAGDLADTVYGGDGLDTVYGWGGNDWIYGGNNDDRIYGGDGNDILRGDSGADLLSGDAGDDDAYGGAGNDTIEGGDGSDTLGGEGDNDSITGNSGIDSMSGGDGNDSIYADNDAGAADIVQGGAGTDCADVDAFDNYTDIEGLF